MATPEQNKIFDAYDEMFATEGWKMFIGEIKQNQSAIFPQLMNTASKVEELFFLKGRNDVYNSILGIQSLMDNVRKEVEDYSDNE